MTAGYSRTPLPKKLGIKDGHRVALLGSPPGFAGSLTPLPPGVTVITQARGNLDVILLFTSRSAELTRRFPNLVGHLTPAGGIWVAWPKKTARVPTDLAFDVVQKIGLLSGLVDNKICAINPTWSGLRFVRRLRDRPAPRKR